MVFPITQDYYLIRHNTIGNDRYSKYSNTIDSYYIYRFISDVMATYNYSQLQPTTDKLLKVNQVIIKRIDNFINL